MNVLRAMKKLRVLCALLVFAGAAMAFLDLYQTLPARWFSQGAVQAQFVPSLLRLCVAGGVLTGASFLIFTVASAIFGRAYCSFVCPLGTLMDGLRRIALWPARASVLKKTALGRWCAKRLVRIRYARARNALRYGVLVCAALLMACGAAGLVGWVEPYTLFGRVAGDVARPALAQGVNALSAALYARDVYAVSPVSGASVAWPALCAGLFILGALFIASALRGRLFCNTLCPVGAFLGIFSRYSLFKIRIDEDHCTHCGQCERTCKAQCIDAKNSEIDASRCVLCFNCVGYCPRAGISYGINPAWLPKRDEPSPAGFDGPDPLRPAGERADKGAGVSRRDVAKLGVGLAALLLTHEKAEAAADSEDPSAPSPYTRPGERPDNRLVSPPGSRGIQHFLDHCTACQLCVSACEGRVLKPSVSQWGLIGFLQPFLDYQRGFCIHGCNRCSQVCPTGAILPLTVPEKLTTKIGTAIFNHDLCVVVRSGTDCAACGEHCPVQAIEMLPFGDPKDSLYIPSVHAEVCIGCGACEYVCPVRPHKAIVVQGLARHGTAKIFTESMSRYRPEAVAPAPSKPADPTGEVFPF